MIRNLSIGAVFLIAFASCRQSTPAESRVEVPTTTVHRMDVRTDIFYVADIQAVRNVEIRARVNGYLEKIFVDEGNAVKEGQLLFKIDDEEYLAQQNRALAHEKIAEAQLKTAQVELERVRLLVNKGVIATTELELAQANLDVAKASIEQAKAEQAVANVRLVHTNIISPFSGMINRIPLKLGSLVSEGTLLTTISDVSAVNVYFQVSETQFLSFAKSNRTLLDSLFKINVELVLADGSTFPAKGKIETVESEFEEGTGVLSVRARFDNPDHLLKHGATGRIKIRRMLKNATLVPQKSVVEIQDRDYVFVIDKNSQAVMKNFVPLGRYKDFYIVKSGLAEGEEIVYEGVQSLREGTVVQPKQLKLTDVYLVAND